MCKCRSAFYVLLYAGMPLAMVAAMFQGNLIPLGLWVAATFTAVGFAARRSAL